jgi:hypothetical protein
MLGGVVEEHQKTSKNMSNTIKAASHGLKREFNFRYSTIGGSNVDKKISGRTECRPQTRQFPATAGQMRLIISALAEAIRETFTGGVN